MNKILHNFGFGVVLKGSTKNPKRTKETVMGFRHDGLMLHVEYCDPERRKDCVQKMFNDYEKVSFINVKPLRGRTVLIKRNF